MSRSFTLSELKTRARRKADMENSDFISENELTEYINESIAELHDILIQKFSSDYYLKSDSLSIVAGTDTYALPSDFYKFEAIDVPTRSNDSISLKRFNFKDRNLKYFDGQIEDSKYRLVGSNLMLRPTPATSVTATIWYHPFATELVNESDSFDGINGYEKFVVLKAAISMLIKEESDTSQLERELQRVEFNIEQASENRDAGEPEVVHDAETVENYYQIHR